MPVHVFQLLTISQGQISAQLKTRGCAYHAQILALKTSISKDTYGKDVMDRFLSELPNDTGAVFVRPDNNKLSIDKGCTCGEKRGLEPRL